MEILKRNEKPLFSLAVEVLPSDNIALIIDNMWKAMYESKGIGLAGNQVGILKRIFVMHANGLKQEFINPVITKRYGGKATSEEGCLSFPGKKVSVIRSKQIIIEGVDRNWKPIKRKLKGLASFCAQHEIDHLNGVTIINGAL